MSEKITTYARLLEGAKCARVNCLLAIVLNDAS